MNWVIGGIAGWTAISCFAMGAYFWPIFRRWLIKFINSLRPSPVTVIKTREVQVPQLLLPEEMKPAIGKREMALRRIDLLPLDEEEKEEFTKYVLAKIRRTR